MEDVRLIHGDCLDVLPTLETASVDSIVTDPPYALSNTQTAKRLSQRVYKVLVQIGFPDLCERNAEFLESFNLAGITDKGSLLGREDRAIRIDTRVSMPKGAVDLQNGRNCRKVEISNGHITPTGGIADGKLPLENKPLPGEFLGDFVLQLGDMATAGLTGDVPDSCLAETFAGGFAVPVFAASTPGTPSLEKGCGAVVFGNEVVWTTDNSSCQAEPASCVVTLPRTVNTLMLRFDARGTPLELRATNRTDHLATLAHTGGTKLIRASAAASCLSAVAKPHRVRLVLLGTHGATSDHWFHLWIPQKGVDLSIIPSGGFMGKAWDAVLPDPEIWRECFRVLKPGGYMLAFGGTRTFHRLMVALEDAGFECRDTLCWLHGQGFPKGKSCLKPAWEPILLCRKPGGGKMKPLNIDECRIACGERLRGTGRRDSWRAMEGRDDIPEHPGGDLNVNDGQGRWPANLVLSHVAPDENGEGGCVCVGTKRVGNGEQRVNKETEYCDGVHEGYKRPNKSCLTHKIPGQVRQYGEETVEEWRCVESCPIRLLNEQAGPSSVTGKRSERSRNAVVEGTTWGVNNHRSTEYMDSGNVSRFFYCSKASRRDRGEGNTHPTVKSTALMSWLVKLVTPPGGLCLDPFAGSGSTLLACLQTGRRGLGIEVNEEYYRIAEKRIAEARAAHPLFDGVA